VFDEIPQPHRSDFYIRFGWEHYMMMMSMWFVILVPFFIMMVVVGIRGCQNTYDSDKEVEVENTYQG
jgi:uncharacterized membrane protein